jgi:ring-1,2-phenylacetyl-CoA epoxidase subunit PaaE
MSRFHTLKVTEVRRETRDAVVVTLVPRDEDRALFDFTQGQYLTFRRAFEGEELRRSYSICAGKHEGVLKVGIKRVEGGAFSTWANENLASGDEIDAMPPMGKFFTPIDASAERHYLGFAGGSGITPVLSIIKTVLTAEPASRFTLVYANRAVGTIMFREELEDLKNIFLCRFSVIHVLETEAQEIDLFTGRINAEKMQALFAGWIDPKSIDIAYICGPEPMMLAIAASLRDHGLTDTQIKFELFASGQPGRARARPVSKADIAGGNLTSATVTLDGTTRSFQMPRQGQSILEAALDNALDAPYSCKAGVCSTCRCKVLEGEVEMMTNHALEDYEVRAGYVLSCQSFPMTENVVVTFDE